ncbi:hypothetical protein JOC85_001863 [Bacillus mesophilus]|uniref:Uncharacterized protein n=1 Tax=Bacillus mesophilus TaxID=1808955 RepID=A0A6M0Q4R0_9BACI|nr:hypothetical protein [Bacillus mesophilus]MBM7661091.1 hypothetical protein [Bacillus mesophilus]NEY71376.1 hypothetical protein [Bacillus mesophilus]
MRKLIFLVMFTLVSIPQSTEAKSSGEPIVFESDEWTLTLEEAEIKNEEMSKGNENADVFSLRIVNNEGKKHNVTVHTFRKEEGKTFDYGMSLNQTKGTDVKLANEEIINVQHFPVAKNTKEFTVSIMWQNEASDQFYKQDFNVPVRFYKKDFNVPVR